MRSPRRAHRSGTTAWRTEHVRLSYGKTLMAVGRYDEASPLVRSAYAVFDSQRALQPRLFAQAVTLLAQVDRRRSR
jgi:predicted Zn-dependent protease